jgi:hypothetical protein
MCLLVYTCGCEYQSIFCGCNKVEETGLLCGACMAQSREDDKTIKISDDAWLELHRVKSLITARRKKPTTYDITILEMAIAYDQVYC